MISPLTLVLVTVATVLTVASTGGAFHAFLVVDRSWSVVDFIPRALAFERADRRSIDPSAARRRRQGRAPLDLVTCTAMLAALVAAARLA